MNVTDPILRVSVVSTGQVQIRPDHLASTWRPTAWWLLASRRWTGPRPINAYVIEHRDGLVLFDTGQDQASVTDPGYFPGGMTGVLYGRLARFEISPNETLSAGLNRLGYAAGDVKTAVISHLHQDHIGGLAELSDAHIVVSQAEWDTLSSPLPELRGLQTGESYAFTAAASIRVVEETLARSVPGAFSPAAAFGADFALTIPDTARIDTIPAEAPTRGPLERSHLDQMPPKAMNP